MFVAPSIARVSFFLIDFDCGRVFQVTVLGSNTRSHIVTHLLPETHYDLKMQAFNMQVRPPCFFYRVLPSFQSFATYPIKTMIWLFFQVFLSHQLINEFSMV